jgi:hypothetical protein
MNIVQSPIAELNWDLHFKPVALHRYCILTRYDTGMVKYGHNDGLPLATVLLLRQRIEATIPSSRVRWQKKLFLSPRTNYT